MHQIITEIVNWVHTLPYWEQFAFNWILEGRERADIPYEEIYQYVLEESNLADKKGYHPKLFLIAEKSEIPEIPSSPIFIKKMSNLQNVNALVPSQEITFNDQLTVIFGANGSGKSGYARVLGCAGFTRGDRVILPDITQPYNESLIPSADIELKIGESIQNLSYTTNTKCELLASCYVFDSTSILAHLSKEFTYSFSPAGLSYLTDLVPIIDNVRKLLTDQINRYKIPHNFCSLFQGESKITSFLENIDDSTDISYLKSLSILSEEEEKQSDFLENRIIELKLLKIPEQKQKLELEIRDLMNLEEKLKKIEDCLHSEKVNKIRSSIPSWKDELYTKENFIVNLLKSDGIQQDDYPIWQKFINVAKEFGSIKHKAKSYPYTGDHCLLCHQILSHEAQELLERIWESKFDLDNISLKSYDKVNKIKSELHSLNFDFFNGDSPSYRLLYQYKPEIIPKIEEFLSTAQKFNKSLLSSIENFHEFPKIFSYDSFISEISRIIEDLHEKIKELEETNPTKEINELGQQLLELKHRKQLDLYLAPIEAYIDNQKWVRSAEKLNINSKHITTKHNELFSNLVTDRYIQLFEEIMRNLKCPKKIIVKNFGRKAEQHKKITFDSDPSIPKDKSQPQQILSEGEKRAVALADFLTEVGLDTNSNAIILDDPVTSLDIEWRRIISAYLVEASKKRQVIIFTHDMPFLYYLKQDAISKSVEMQTHWIQKGESDGKPGYVFLNNSPALEADYKKSTKAREMYKQAKNEVGDMQESTLKYGFSALRSSYEALVIFGLFNDVVRRFEERISIERLNKVVSDPSLIEQIVENYGRISRYIEGHLHSDIFCAEKPTCKLLNDEINNFETIQTQIKALKADLD